MRITAESLDPTVVSNLIQDGRIAGLFAEPLVRKELKLHKPDNNCSKEYDAIDDDSHKYEIKIFNRKGCNFRPSYMKGVGRSFDATKFKNYLNSLHGLILVSCIDHPNWQVVIKKPSDLYEQFKNGKISFKYHNDIFLCNADKETQ